MRGRTVAVLNAVGKEPVCKDVLTMSVMAGSRYGVERHMISKTLISKSLIPYFRDRMKAREWCSGERWVRGAWLKRCVVKLVMHILNFSREERREYGWQFRTVRGRHSGGIKSARKFIHDGVLWLKKNQWCGCYSVWFWRRKWVSGLFFLINLWTVSFVECHQCSACWRLCLAWLISSVYQGAYGQVGRRFVVVGAYWSKSWQRVEL